MTRFSFLSLWLLSLLFRLAQSGQAQGSGLDTRAPIGAFLNNTMPPLATPPGPWAVVVAFPNLTFEDAVFLCSEPRTNRLYVCGHQGVIWFFQHSSTVTDKTVFLDIRSRTQGYESCGLLGMAFHPEFRQPGSTNRGYVYIYYSYSPNPLPGPNPPPLDTATFDRLSRFTVPDGSLTADPNSELVLVNQYDRHIWHEGGSVFFGDDGFLYFANGDEGGVSDPYNTAQKLDGGLFSGVFRIDVNNDPARSHPIRRQPRSGGTGSPASYTGNYSIPNDNPFLDSKGGLLEEYWALGLRSPHRTTFDPGSSKIWLGDVGQDSYEEIDIIQKGGNYQWPFGEGLHPGPKATPSPLTGTSRPPVYDYPHDQGNSCVIGGYVYRGAQFAADLAGKYIFGDNGSGRIWAVSYDGINPPTLTNLCNMPAATTWTGLTSFGLDENGELLMCKMGSAEKIYKLIRTGTPPLPPPQLLSQTGAFADLGALTPNNGIIPYDVNVPLWSDGAIKRRWISVPNDGQPYSVGETVGFASTGEWSFPNGTVFIKHFELPVDDRNPSILRRLETRLLVRDNTGAVYGLTYKWRSDKSDADLLSSSLSEDIPITNSAGGIRTQTYYYPSQQDCLVCHNGNANYVLGVKTRQLNRSFTYPSTGLTDNQLRTWNHLGLLNPPIDEASIPSYAKLSSLNDGNSTLADRVRSYLDANCAQCHRPNGVFTYFDARYDTPLGNQRIINGTPINPMGISGARIIVPQSTSQSVMFQRLNTTGAYKMPLLARNVIDAQAVSVFTDWINSLTPTLFSPWNNADIGAVGQMGSADYSNGIFTVSGSGADIFDNADAFQFVYQPWSGDGQIIARVTGVQNTDGWAKAGVMFRESLNADARHAMMLVSATQGSGFERRIATSGTTAWTPGSNVTAPYWVKLKRSAANFNAYGSADGITWTLVGTDTISMATPIYAGLALTSHNTSMLNTSSFDNVTVVTGTTGQAPAFSSVQFDPRSGLHFEIDGNAGASYGIEASVDLIHWTNISTLQNVNGTVTFTDDSATNFPQRYYRARVE